MLSGIGIILGVDISSTKDVLGLILVILNIIILIISFGLKIYTWVKKSLDDKKIDDNEIQELQDIVDEAADKIGDLKNEKKENDKNTKEN